MKLSKAIFLAILTIGISASGAHAQSPEMSHKGYNLPFYGTKELNQNLHHGQAIDFRGEFEVAAVGAGTVIYLDDTSPDTWTGLCPGITPAVNFIVLGHERKLFGGFGIYTVYYHLKKDSIPDWIKVGTNLLRGEKIGVTGRTGYASGIHLHFFATEKPPTLRRDPVIACTGSGLMSERTWVDVGAYDQIGIGFLEYGNRWPLLEGGTGNITSLNKPPESKSE